MELKQMAGWLVFGIAAISFVPQACADPTKADRALQRVSSERTESGPPIRIRVILPALWEEATPPVKAAQSGDQQPELHNTNR